MSLLNLDDPTLEVRIAQAVTLAFARNARLPEWLQMTALGRDMTPLGELAAAAVIKALRASQEEPAARPGEAANQPIPVAKTGLVHIHTDEPLVQIGWQGQTGRFYILGEAPQLTEPGGFSPIFRHWGEPCGHQIQMAENDA